MTSSFSFHDPEEQLLFALAPQRVKTALREDFEQTMDLLRHGQKTDQGSTPARIKLLQAWASHKKLCHPTEAFERCAKENITILFPEDARWPIRFNGLETHRPSVLFLRGNIPSIPYIAVIGSRQPTAYGERVTETIGRDLAQTSIGIVSGLALGTDGHAHRAALNNQLPTLAILGSSISRSELYPSAHTHLADEIIAQGGGILSEAPPGAKIHPGSFPERNRLIAALCHALIVIEAREKSGTLITARMALEMNREVLAVPGNIFSEASVGTHSLIAAGARLYTGVADLWKALTLDAPTAMRTIRTSIQLSTEDKQIITCLQNVADGVPPTKLNELLNLEESTLFSRLGLLELQGLIRQTFAGNWIAT